MRRDPGRVAMLLVVWIVSACGAATTDGSTDDPAPSRSDDDPTGVVLWLHDGARSWPPTLTALELPGRATTPVDLPVAERAIDWDWSPDLSRLAWLEQVPDGVPAARVVLGRPDGSERVVVGELRNWNDYRGRAWSDDGARFAYAAYTDEGASVRVIDATTGHSDEVRTWDVPVHVDVDWSPDGSRLVLGVVGDGDGTGLFTIGADGIDERRLSDLAPWRVRWSPSGATIAVEAGVGRGPIGIHVVSVDGGDERRLSPPDVTEMTPVWSPDGAWLAFASEREAEDPPPPGAPREQPLTDAGLFVMRADGTDVRRLVAPLARGWPEAWDWFASWPPPAVGG